MTVIYGDFGVRLADWRKEKGWTQAQLGRAIGVAQPVVSDMERADNPSIPKPVTMRRIYLVTAGAVTPNDFYDLPDISGLGHMNEAA